MTQPLTDAELADLERLDREATPGTNFVLDTNNVLLAASRNALPRLLAMVRVQRARLDFELKARAGTRAVFGEVVAKLADAEKQLLENATRLEQAQTVVLEAAKARGEAERELAKWRELQWDDDDNCLVCGVWQGSGGCRSDCAFDLALRKAGLQS